MGLLIEQNDSDLAEKYERMVADSPVLTVIEDWSFPTYMRDARPNSDFALPSSILLRNTAAEVIREVNEYSDAYVHYLLSTYLPLASRPGASSRLAELPVNIVEPYQAAGTAQRRSQECASQRCPISGRLRWGR